MSNVIEIRTDGDDREILGALDEVCRAGAEKMLHLALELEVERYVGRHQGERDENGRALVTRNGKARPRKVTVGSGTLKVTAPRVRDEREGESGDRCRFTSAILPPYMRRSPKVAEVLPVLYLRGLSTGDFEEALSSLLGKESSAGLSATTITRLTAEWQKDYAAFKRRDLRGRRYAYLFADGIHFRIRLEADRLCALVLIGVREDGSKEIVAVEDGYRESRESWLSVLRDLARRGLESPLLAIGDGALGFWGALSEVWPEAAEQRCWVHRTANVLDKLPKPFAAESEGSPASDLSSRDEGDRSRRSSSLRGGVRRPVSEGGGLPASRRREAVDVLRLPGGALADDPKHERDRVGVRDGSVAAEGDEGRGVANEGPDDGLQAVGDGAIALASASKPRARSGTP